MPSPKTLLLASVIALLPVISHAADKAPAAPETAAAAISTLSEAQKTEVENIVRELLTKKEPEIVVRAAQAVRQQVETANEAKSAEALKNNLDKIVKDPTSPTAGNLKGDVTIVEFFDYSCGYCKMAQPTVLKLLGEDKNVKFIYKELPILGDGSVAASKAALASVAQGKYHQLHDALMSNKGQLTDESVLAIAKSVGINTDKLKKDMTDPKIENTIKANHDLAQMLGFQGTPTFIIGDKLFPGAMPYEKLTAAVAQVREEAKASKK